MALEIPLTRNEFEAAMKKIADANAQAYKLKGPLGSGPKAADADYLRQEHQAPFPHFSTAISPPTPARLNHRPDPVLK